jgi:hypothetical protein
VCRSAAAPGAAASIRHCPPFSRGGAEAASNNGTKSYFKREKSVNAGRAALNISAFKVEQTKGDDLIPVNFFTEQQALLGQRLGNNFV